MLKMFANFKKKISKGGAFVLALTMPFAAASCTYEDIPTHNETLADTDLSTDNNLTVEIPEKTNTNENCNKIYDFPFLKCEKKELVDNEEIDWDSVEKVLKNKNPDFCFLVKFELNQEVNHAYEIARYEEAENFGSYYHHIVDKYANYVDYIKYDGVIIPVNKDVSILGYSDDYDMGRMRLFTLLNHNDGSTKTIEAASLQSANGYIIRLMPSYDGRTNEYTLLYPNGDLAVLDIYDDILYDSYTGNLFLNKGDNTEVVDTVTGKAKRLPVKVVAAKNGYLTISDGGKEGISYLEDLESDLIENIPCEFDYVTCANLSEKPIFVGRNYKGGVEYASDYLYSAEGELLSKGYHDIGYDSYSTGYIDVTMSVDSETGRKIMGLVNYNGKEVLNNVDAAFLQHIPLTDKVVFKENGNNGKYGIMDLNGNILQEATYDRILLTPLEESDEIVDVLIVCRSEEQQKTVVFNRELGEELSGDFGYEEAINKAFTKQVKVYSK